MQSDHNNNKNQYLERLKTSPKAITLLVINIVLLGFLSQISEFGNTIAPTIVGTLMIFIIIVLLTFLIFTLKADEKKPDTPEPDSEDIKGNRLTRLVNGFVGLLWYLGWAVAVVLPIMAATMSIQYFEGSPTWGVDMSVFLGFVVDQDLLLGMSQGLRKGEMMGTTMLSIDTNSVKAWYLFIATNEVMILLSLYVLYQMRGLFAKFVKGQYFLNENASRIMRAGVMILLGAVIVPVMQYFSGLAILEEIKFSIPGVEVFPSFQETTGLFLGVLVIILGGIWREAAVIYDDHKGTI